MLLTSIIVWMFFDCAGTPCTVTGPSGSDVMCCALWVLNILAWVPLGLILLWCQKKQAFYAVFDCIQPLFYLVAVLVTVWAVSLLKDDTGVTKSNCYIIILITLVANYLPAVLIYLIARATEHVVAPNRSLPPSSDSTSDVSGSED